MEKLIPVSRPLIEKKDIESVVSALKKNWISSEGPEVKKLEKNFSKLIGHKYGVAVSNGTAALEIAIKSLNLRKNDEVIIPNFTIFSNALAVIKQNLKIRFIDCGLFDWNMDLNELEKKINKNTKAIIATHIYNFPIQMNKLKKICKKKKIIIIEDAAEVIGQKIGNVYCGGFGDISTYSFYSNKQITSGEGGMITTNNATFYKKACSLRNLCFGRKDRFNHDDIGWNYRMTNLQASLALSQLKRISYIVKQKEKIGKLYFENLKNNKNIFIPSPKNSYSKNIYWVVGILIINKKLKKNAKKTINYLKKKGIGSRPFFWPMNKQNILKKLKIKSEGNFKNSEYISKYGFYVPSSIDLTKREIKYICKVINNYFN